jgi:hypothetical protein
MTKEPLIIENNGLDAPPQTDDTGILWESRVNALLRERAAYVKRDLGDRVKSVDAELERIGYRGSKTVGDTRDLPVTETTRALPKATPKDAPSAKDGGK